MENGLIYPPKLIRVWFDTVLNPIYTGLKNESYLLSKKDYTWKHYLSSCEKIINLGSYISVRYIDNFEQFLCYFDNIEDVINKHDSCLSELNKLCSELFDMLISSNEVKNIFDSILDKIDFHSGFDLEAFKREENIIWIIEYIINNKGELGSERFLRIVWNSNIDSFKNILSDTKYKEIHNLIFSKANELNNIVSNSLKFINEIRRNLSINNDVPIVLPKELEYEQ